MNTQRPHNFSEVDPTVNPDLGNPDIPRSSDTGYYFQQYITQRFVGKRDVGSFVYNAAPIVPVPISHIKNPVPFTISRTGDGVLLIEDVVSRFIVGAYSYHDNALNVRLVAQTDGSLHIRMDRSGTAHDGAVLIYWLKL